MEDLTPLYNKEFYLAYLCGEDVVLPIPDGNAERYLAYLCGMDVTIPDVPDGRTETYLAYKCGEDVVLPDPMYRIEYYLAKWCGIDCEVPEPLYRIEYWLAQLANSGELKTVTGNPITVSDALAKPAESLTIEILPSQSGSGDPSPDNVRPISGWSNVNVTRTGKNLLDVANATHNAYNIGSIHNTLKMGVTYTFSVNGTTDKRYRLYLAKNDNPLNALIPLISGYIAGGNSITFTAPNMDGYDLLCIAGSSNGAGNEPLDNILPQLELGSTATAYEPYAGTTYSISWQDEAGTVYCGSLDVTSGVMTVTHGIIDLGDLNYNPSTYAGVFGGLAVVTPSPKPVASLSTVANAVCSALGVVSDATFNSDGVKGEVAINTFGYLNVKGVNATTKEELKAEMTGIMLCYELATPQTIQLTPTEVQMLLGDNTIWNDVGDMTLEYLADGPADDADALMILLGNRYVNNGGADEATDREALDILLGGNTR